MLKPGYKQTEVGIIPEDWEISNIGSIANIIDPQPDHRTPPEVFGGEPYIGISDFTSDNNVNWDSCRKIISKAVDKQRASFQLQEGDIIFGKIGTIGSPKFVPVTPFRYALSANIILIKPKINPYYVMAWFKSYQVQKLINQELHSTSQAAFGINKMRHLQIPLPPTLEEQRAIAEALSDADALIESLEQLIAKKRAIKQGAMQELLTGKRRLPGFDGEWENVLFSEMGKCYRGVSYNPTIDLYPYDNLSTVRLLRSNNIQDMEINVTDIQYVHFNKVSSEQYLRENDILICMANGSRDLVGKTGRFIEKDDFKYTFGAFMGCFRIYEDVINHNFVHYLFQTASYRYQISVLLAGSSINNLTPTSIESLTAYIPQDKSEQAAIATVLSDMDSEIAALEAKLNKAQQIKQGMMQELLTGKTRLLAASSSCPEPTDIPKQLEVSI
jgi:type I restriction enzyme S subunit